MERREILSIGGMALATFAAGCSSSEPEVVEEDEIENGDESDDSTDEEFDGPFPEGFSQNGIESFDVAFGPESVFYNLDSLEFEISNTQDMSNRDEQQIEMTGWSSGEEERMYRKHVNSDELGGERVISEYATENGTMIRNVSPENEVSFSFSEDETFDRENAYYIDEIDNTVGGYEFHAEDAPDVSNGGIRYTRDVAEGDQIYPDSDFITILGGDTAFVITNDGYPVEISFTFEVQHGDNVDDVETLSEHAQFSQYGDADKTEPEWLSEGIEQTEATADMFD